MRQRVARQLGFAATELGLWAALYALYLLVRSLAIGNAREAFVHASQVIRLEQIAGLFGEGKLQHALASVGGVRLFFNAYYMLGFGPLLGVTLLWLGIRHRDAYRALRRAMLVSLAIATIPFIVYPTAPPRLVAGLGIADTVGLSGHDTGSFAGIRFDPYAAVPSMHVGWSILLALVGVRVFSKPWLRLFFAVHPLLMAVAVTATGNHYFFDSLAGTAVALTGLALTSCRPLRLWQRALASVVPVGDRFGNASCRRAGEPLGLRA